MTSYQKRKREIKYYKQCIEELENIAKKLVDKLIKNNMPIGILDEGIKGDTIITPYNSGEFSLELSFRQGRKV